MRNINGARRRRQKLSICSLFVTSHTHSVQIDGQFPEKDFRKFKISLIKYNYPKMTLNSLSNILRIIRPKMNPLG